MEKYVIQIDGGWGRNICALPAIEKLAKDNDVYIAASFPQVFEGSKFIKRVYNIGQPYFFQDVIKDRIFIKPEPYQHHMYYQQKHHLIQSFNYLINSVDDMLSPKLVVSDELNKWAIDYIAELKRTTGYYNIVVFQPFGASAKQVSRSLIDDLPEGISAGNPVYDSLSLIPDSVVIEDTTNRSLSYSQALDIVESTLNTGFLNMSRYPVNHVCVYNKNFSILEWTAIIKNCDLTIGIDSSLIHIASAFDKNGFYFFGSSSIANLGYDQFTILQRDGYPKEFDAVRFGGADNSGAMDFNKDEFSQMIKLINNTLDQKE